MDTKPALTITWNPDVQAVQVRMETEQVKTFEFGLGLLAMATQQLEDMRRTAQMQAMQEAAQAMQQRDMILRNGLRRG